MVKFLVVGDFHGKLSKKLENKIKKENPDIILSPGDFCGNERLAKLFFKYYYSNETPAPNWVDNEMEKLDKKALVDGLKSFRKLKSLNKETYSIFGNWDPTLFGHDIGARVRKEDKKDFTKFKKILTNKFKLIEFKLVEFENFVLVGGVSSSAPIKIDKKTLERIRKNASSKKKIEKAIKRRVNAYNFRQKKYGSLFKKAKSLQKPIIFLTHNAPYKTKLDKVKTGPAKGENLGSYQERLLINRFQPDLVVTGHMHENFGKDKIKNSTIINSGTAMENNYITFEFDEEKKRFWKFKFEKA